MDRGVDRVEKIISIGSGFITIATAAYTVLIAAPSGSVVSESFRLAPLHIESLPLKIIMVVVVCLSLAASSSMLLVYLGQKLKLIYIILIVVLSMIFSWIALSCTQWIALGPYKYDSDWMMYYVLLAAFSAGMTAVFIFIRAEPTKFYETLTQPVWFLHMQMGTQQVRETRYGMALHPALISLIQALAYAALFHASIIRSY